MLTEYRLSLRLRTITAICAVSINRQYVDVCRSKVFTALESIIERRISVYYISRFH